MRFHAPPGWPPTPPDWTPEPGWEPDPQWPTPPPAWAYWLDDHGMPLRPRPGATLPPWDLRSADLSTSRAQDVDRLLTEVRAVRRRALRTFWLAVVVVVAAAAGAIAAADAGGGLVWVAGLFVGVALAARAWRAHRSVRGFEAPGSALGRGAVVVGLAVAGAAGYLAVTTPGVMTSEPLPPAASVGSCWQDGDDGALEQVPCSGPHAYRVSLIVADSAQCPVESRYVVTLDKRLGCLVED